MKRKFYLIMALVLALLVSGGTYAYTYTSASAEIGGTAKGDIAAVAPAAEQPNWNSVLPQYSAATEILRPNAAGDRANLTQNPASGENWDKVKEVTVDYDSTYVAHNGGWANDLYNITNHSVGSGIINYVKVYINCRATDTPTQTSAKAYIKTNGSEYSGNENTVTTSYALYSYQWNTNPKTGNAWTWEEINDLQIGSALSKANDLTKWTRCTQVYAEVHYQKAPVTRGEVPSGNLFVITPDPAYTGDLLVNVYLINTAALTKAYQYLNMKLYLQGSVEASQTPNYRVLSLENGVATFNLVGITGGSYTLSVIGGSYALISGDSSQWATGWSLTPEFYCEIAQR